MADFGGELDAFRAEVRDWLKANYPAELREPERRDRQEAMWGGRAFAGSDDPQIVWMKRVAAKGWTAPTWPRQYGGGGLSPAEGAGARAGAGPHRRAARSTSFGIWMLGPVLLEYANEEQKAEHLPEDRPRRDPLVPGLFRAGRRLRPRRPADPAARTRATTG